MHVKINENIFWRNEKETLMILHPVQRRLFFFGKIVSDNTNKDGVIRLGDDLKEIQYLLEQGIVDSYDGDIKGFQFGSDPIISAPLNVTIQITNRCNLTCIHCHRVDKGCIDIEYKRLTSLIDELAEMRVFNVNISGGEPLMYDRIFDLVSYIRLKGMKVTMSTNLVLWDEKIAKRFFDLGLKQLHISLDSSNDAEHNRIRGSKIAYQRTLRNLAIIKKIGIEFTLVTTLTNQSIDEYAQTIDFTHAVGACAHKTNLLVPQGQGSKLEVCYYKNTDLLKRYTDVFHLKKREYTGRMAVIGESMFEISMKELGNTSKPKVLQMGCPSGILTCAVTEKGELLSCPFYSEVSIGNVYENSFKKLWNKSRLLTKIRKLKNNPWSGCQARAFGLSGSMESPDPFVYEKSPDDYGFYNNSAKDRNEFIKQTGYLITIDGNKGNVEFYSLVHPYLINSSETLEIGCGTGIVSQTLGYLHKKIISVDFSENMLALAKENCKNYNHISFKKEDLNKLSFKDGTFDLVIKRLAPDNLGEIIRVLNEHGDFINFTNGENDGKELKEMFNLPLHESVSQYKKRLINVGFKIIQEEEFIFREIYSDLDTLMKMLEIAPIVPDFQEQKGFYLNRIQEYFNRNETFSLTRHKYLTHAKK